MTTRAPDKLAEIMMAAFAEPLVFTSFEIDPAIVAEISRKESSKPDAISDASSRPGRRPRSKRHPETRRLRARKKP